MRVFWSAEPAHTPGGPGEVGPDIVVDLAVEHGGRSATARCLRTDPSARGPSW